MGILDSIFGKKITESKEKTEIRTENQQGKRTKVTEVVIEKDSEGKVVSKKTTTEEVQEEQ